MQKLKARKSKFYLPHILPWVTGLFFLFSPGLVFSQFFQNTTSAFSFSPWVTNHSLGAGVSFYDINGDGLDDMTFCINRYHLHVYMNTGTGYTFYNNLVPVQSENTHAVWVDYDNDGHMDLFISGFMAKNRLYRNNGNFSFTDVTQEAGLPLNAHKTAGVSFGDYDRDGYLDLYVSNYSDPESNFDDTNRLYKNNGNGTFTDVTQVAGVGNGQKFSFICAWIDYDNDNWPDLYVINDKFPPNALYKNNRDGTFTEVTDIAGVGYPFQDPMSATVGDFDNDGDLDLYMSNSGGPTMPPILAVNNGDETFTDLGPDMGLYLVLATWGAIWIDMDNDGWQDLYVCASANINNHLYQNLQGDSLALISGMIGNDYAGDSYTCAKGDWNNDGYADIVVNNNAPGFNMFLSNNGGSNHYIKVTPNGTLSNPQAIGTWMRVYHDGKTYSHYTMCGEAYLGQNSQHHIFGLGESDAPVDSIIVTYNRGHIDRYYNLAVDVSYTFTEGETYQASITSDSDLGFCLGDSIVLDAGVHEVLFWNTGDTTRYITVSEGGTYSVSTSNDSGLNSSASVVVSAYPNPIISYDLEPIMCYGESQAEILLINQSQVAANSVIWSNGMTGENIDSLSAGVYQYVYIDINGCEATGDVEISEPTELILFSEGTPATEGLANGTILYSVFGGTQPHAIYFEGEIITGAITDLESGSYILQVKDANDCIVEDKIIIDQILSTRLPSNTGIRIYPNPTSDKVYIESQDPVSQVSVMSIHGTLIKQFKAVESGRYDLNQIAPGIYLIKVSTSDGQIWIQRLVRQ